MNYDSPPSEYRAEFRYRRRKYMSVGAPHSNIGPALKEAMDDHHSKKVIIVTRANCAGINRGKFFLHQIIK